MTLQPSNKELLFKIEELEQTIRVLKTDLIHDSLTGLKTRRFFEQEARVYLDAVVERHGGTRKEWFSFRHLSFVFFDVDDFKKINDTYGHATGDGVLKAVAMAIEDGVRKGDIAARWGGEEIVVALVGAKESDAVSKAEKIRKSIEKLSFNSLPGVKVTISAGVASAEVGIGFEETIDRADKALYVAKNAGRNQVVKYSEIAQYQ